MKYILLLSSLLLTLKAFSNQENDSATIVKLLADDYKTMVNWDINTHVKNCTDNYLLIENGEIWDIKRESEYYRANANRVVERKDYFDIKYVRVHGDFAYAVYFLKSDINEDGNLKIMTWNESVIFRKIKDAWKIELIHSTPTDIQK